MTFRTIAAILEQQCPEAIETYIISGCGDAANLLEVLLLAREARLVRPDEIAAAVYYLATEGTAYCGEVLSPNAGAVI